MGHYFGVKMKLRLLLPVLLLFSLAAAKDRVWKDAVFLGLTTSTAGAAAMPIGNMVVAFPLSGRIYWVRCDGVTYALTTDYTGHWPNLTVNGHTKLAIEGRKAHILDEDNKDRKFTILEKSIPKEQ
jgi:hypothetical protein